MNKLDLTNSSITFLFPTTNDNSDKKWHGFIAKNNFNFSPSKVHY